VENLAKAAKLSDAYGYDEINLKFVQFLFANTALGGLLNFNWVCFVGLAAGAPVLR